MEIKGKVHINEEKLDEIKLSISLGNGVIYTGQKKASNNDAEESNNDR